MKPDIGGFTLEGRVCIYSYTAVGHFVMTASYMLVMNKSAQRLSSRPKRVLDANIPTNLRWARAAAGLVEALPCALHKAI